MLTVIFTPEISLRKFHQAFILAVVGKTTGSRVKTLLDVTLGLFPFDLFDVSSLVSYISRAIEDNVRATCGHLVEECVVVGYGRPSPALFVEALVSMDHDDLRREIIRLIRPFNSRRYVHERITSEKMVIVVPSKTLPRTATKGNIRRKVVENAYKSKLDAIYSSSQ
jgi:hypothetical protein